MHITIIAAMDKKGCIGKQDGRKGLPWHLPGDMKHFRRITKDKPMVFGRKTFEAFGAKALPNRPNIIVTSNESYHALGCDIVHSLEEALSIAKTYDSDEIIICGGSQIYAESLAKGLVSRMVLTEIDLDVEGDAFFPSYMKSEWRECSREPQEENDTRYDFVVYEKR